MKRCEAKDSKLFSETQFVNTGEFNWGAALLL
jgi:hypothetical protein